MLLQKKNIKDVMPFLWDELYKKTKASEGTGEMDVSIWQIRIALRTIKKEETKEEAKIIQRSILPTNLPESIRFDDQDNLTMLVGTVMHFVLTFPVFMVIGMYLGLGPGYAVLSYVISSMLSSIIFTYRRTHYGEIYFTNASRGAIFRTCLAAALGIPCWHIASNRWWRWRIRRALHTPLNTKTLASADKKIRAIKKKLKAIDEIAEETDDSRLKMVQITLKAEIRKKEEEAERMLLDMLTSIEKRRKHIFAHANSIWPYKAEPENTAKRRKAIKEVERIAVALDNGNAKETQDLSIFIAIAEMRRETEEA